MMIIQNSEWNKQIERIHEQFQKLNSYYENVLFRVTESEKEIGDTIKKMNQENLHEIQECIDSIAKIGNRLCNWEQDVSELYKRIDKVERDLAFQHDNYLRLDLSFRIIESKIDELQNKLCENNEFSIIKTKRFSNNFEWYVNKDACDNVTRYIRGGYIGKDPDWDAIDENLWELLPKKGVFLDIGANIGAFSLPLASFGWRGYAIEASEMNTMALEKSIEVNKFDVVLLNKVIWERSGKINFVQKGPQGFVEDFIHKDENYEELEAICLDDYHQIEEFDDLDKIDFIKIDIEGAEVAALRGMKKFLADMDYPPIYLEVNIWNLFCFNESPKTLFKEVELLGYCPYMFYKGSLLKYDSKIFPNNPCVDYLFLKEIPDYIKCKIVGEKGFNANDNIIFARKEMLNFKNWVMDYGRNPNEVLAHIAWYSLIHEYPECREDSEIQELRREIKDNLSQSSNPIFNRMLLAF